MASRYCGQLKITVLYTDQGDYRASVQAGKAQLWKGRIGAPPAGFGPGVAYDSPEAYDSTAHAALSFAADDGADLDHLANFNAHGYALTRAKPAKG
jgi:hypothetical protein